MYNDKHGEDSLPDGDGCNTIGENMQHDYCEGNERTQHYHDRIRQEESAEDTKEYEKPTKRLMQPQSNIPED